MHICSALPQFSDGLIQMVLAYIRNDDLAARCRKHLCLAECSAAAAARDEGYLPVEFFHTFLPLSCPLEL